MPLLCGMQPALKNQCCGMVYMLSRQVAGLLVTTAQTETEEL